jgi:hypothetical protein
MASQRWDAIFVVFAQNGSWLNSITFWLCQKTTPKFMDFDGDLLHLLCISSRPIVIWEQGML